MLRISPALGSLTLVITVALMSAGCQEEATIASYETPRTAPPAKAVNAEDVRASLDHMFAAVVPHGKQAWFFKLVAPAAVAEKLKQPFDEFVKSIELGEPGEQPKWRLAEGWTETAGGGEMRAATITIPHDEAPLELTVSALPFDEAWSPYLERNVARWLDQLQQGSLTSSEIEKIARKLPVKGGDATAFELVGVMKRTGPMMGSMPAGHPPVGKEAGETKEKEVAGKTRLPAPPPGDQASAADPAAEFTADAPAGWQVGPPRAMRKATYLISEGGGAADLSVTAFGAAPMMADPLANARRWAGELGLSSLTDDELKAATSDVRMDGAPGKLVELIAPEGAGAQATVAAMIPRGDQIWFFKLKGDRATVEGQRDAFKKFLDSVKFAGEK